MARTKKNEVPQYVINLINRMNAHIAKAQDLNEQLEAWIEESGISPDGFDYTFENRDSMAYAIFEVDAFVSQMNEDLQNC